MGWRDRAIAVEAPAAGWRSRARSVAPEVSGLESTLRGGAQGLSLGFADELAGVAGAVGGALAGDERDFADRYRQERDESRAAYHAAEEANPGLYRAGEVGGGVAGMFVPGLGAGRGLAGAIGAGAALGGAAGLGGSESDLTRGDIGGALADTAGGAALGAAGGAVGHGLGQLAGSIGRRIAGRAGGRAGAAEAEINRLAAEKGGEEVQALAGRLGGEVQKGSRMAENLRRVGGRLEPAAAERLGAAEPELVALERRVAAGNLRDLPGQVGTIDAAEAALRQAQETLPARVAQLTADIGNPMNQVGPRLQRYLPPVLGDLVGGAAGQTAAGAVGRAAVGAGLGAAFTGDTKGAAAGALAGAGMRPAFQSILRGIRHPSVQRAVWSAVQKMAERSSGFLGRYGPLLGRVAASNLDDAFNLHKALLARDDDYAEKVARALEAAASETQTPDGGMVTP